MEEPTVSFSQLGATSRQIAQRLLTIGENRLELLTVELQEERERLLHAFLLALCVTALGLLAGMTFTAALVVIGWSYSPLGVLLTLTALYGAAAVYLGRRLSAQLRDWQALSATLDQLRKDRACLAQSLN